MKGVLDAVKGQPMMLAKVMETRVDGKHAHYKGQKILVVQPVTRRKAKGKSLLAVDGVQAVSVTRPCRGRGGSARTVVGDETLVTIGPRSAASWTRGCRGCVRAGGPGGGSDGIGRQRDVVRSVAIGSDHGAYAQKEALATYLRTLATG